MTDSFDEEELYAEEEWVEISDIEGRKASYRHLATVRMDDLVYHVLGEEKKKSLMLVREEKMADGASQYVIASNEHEVRRVVERFVMHAIEAHLQEHEEELQDGFVGEGMSEACGYRHVAGDFCYCDDPVYLQ